MTKATMSVTALADLMSGCSEDDGQWTGPTFATGSPRP